MKKVNDRMFFQDEKWWFYRASGQKVGCSVGNCEYCKEDFVYYPIKWRGKEQKHCSKKCAFSCVKENKQLHEDYGQKKAESHHHWKGGRIKDRNGYVLVYSPDHPELQGTKRKYIREHRLVMEKKLGRRLFSNETVHHKNGIRDDNRLENLELWEHQPYGQRKNEIKHCPTCACN